MPTSADSQSTAITGYAQKFDEYRAFLNKTVRINLDIFQIPKTACILDVGCAFGDDIRRLQRLGYTRVSGVEPDPYCVSHCTDLDVTLGSLEATGRPDGFFDVVLVDNVFHHCSDYEAALTEIARVLKQGGLLCFIEPRRSMLRLALDFVTFRTPVPRLLGGPFRLRHTIMGDEIATGLYPKWLRSHDVFFAELDRSFETVWRRNRAFFVVSKVRKR